MVCFENQGFIVVQDVYVTLLKLPNAPFHGYEVWVLCCARLFSVEKFRSKNTTKGIVSHNARVHLSAVPSGKLMHPRLMPRAAHFEVEVCLDGAPTAQCISAPVGQEPALHAPILNLAHATRRERRMTGVKRQRSESRLAKAW